MQAPKDLFSAQAAAYRQFRPQYPAALYAYLLQQVAGRQRAWDCGTGNGQVAALLANQFAEVQATDISEAQLLQAIQKPNIHYSRCRAESTPFPDQYFDLVTVAQALHWFSFAPFFREVMRVLKPKGVLAVWGYGLLRIEPAIDAELDHFYSQVVGPYWDAERRHIDAAYATIALPFARTTKAPPFAITQSWTLQELEGYLFTWSAVQKYMAAEGKNPLPALMQQLAPLWPASASPKRVRFPVFLQLAHL